MNGLFDKFREVWGWRKAKDLGKKKARKEQLRGDEVFATIYQKFQEEMGAHYHRWKGGNQILWIRKFFSGRLIYRGLNGQFSLIKEIFNISIRFCWIGIEKVIAVKKI